MPKLTFVLGLAIALTACGSAPDKAHDPAAAVAKQAAQEARDAAAKAAEEAAAPAPVEPLTLSLADLMADLESRLGQPVTLSAVYVGHEAGAELTHATLAASADEGAATLMCHMIDGSALEGLEAGAEIEVSGTLAATEDGTPGLQDCLRTAPSAEPAADEGDAAPDEP